MGNRVNYTKLHRNNVPGMDLGRNFLTLRWIVAGILVLALLLGCLYFLIPRPMLSEGEPAASTDYMIYIQYSGASHENEVELYDESNGINSDTSAEHYILSAKVEEQMEALLQTYEMRRTFPGNDDRGMYNITRFSEKDSLMNVFAEEDQVLVQRDSKWYRVIEPQDFFLKASSLLDRYVESCRAEIE